MQEPENNLDKKSRSIISEVQLILAEKRTSLAMMRTGIAVFVLPLSVLSVLIATSRYYEIVQVAHFLLPLLIICAALTILGAYLIIKSVIKLRQEERLILNIKRKHSEIADLLE